MRTAIRAMHRVALVGGLWLVGTAGLPIAARAGAPSERVLPDSTVFMFKINDVKQFREGFRGSHYGQLWNDPSMKDFRDDLTQKLKDATRPIKEKIGVDLGELMELPQGPLTVAVLGRDDPRFPLGIVVMADAGANKGKMTDVLKKLARQAEETGARASEETFNGLTLHILRVTPDEKPKAKDEKANDAPPELSASWAEADGTFYMCVGSPGGGVELLKDLTAHREGRDNALAANENFARTQNKVGSDKAQAVWFLDFGRLIKLVLKANAKGNEAQAQQSEAQLQMLGINGLKSVGGSLSFGAGRFDTLTRTFFLAPKPTSGILKIFSFPPIRLRPEPWVPATVASYQTFSWDLDNAFDAINELVNTFQPGMLNILEGQLAGPNGEPLSFQKDIFGPLGDRITLITDFKKPVKEDSQRMLLGVALEDAKAFQATFNRILELAGAAPAKREFQGTTIYDFDFNVPNPNAAGAAPTMTKISLAVAKNTLFITPQTSLLEQVLRPGNAPLEENASFQTLVKEMPESASGMTFVRPEESARVFYDLIKSGQYEKAVQQMFGANARGPRPQQVPQLGKVIANEKLPEFSELAKYLTLSGSYSLMEDDGFTMTGFTLKRQGP